MDSNVVALPGCVAPSTKPNEQLVEMLADLLEYAKSGMLQCLVGTGFMSDGARLTVLAEFHPNVVEMRGAIAWLEDEYADRVHKRLGGSE